MRALLFFLLNGVILLMVGQVEGVKMLSVFQPGPMMMIFGPQLIYLHLNTGREFGSFLKRALTKRLRETDEDLFVGAIYLGLFQGVVGAILGASYVWGQWNDLVILGKGMGFALCCIFYAAYSVLLSILFLKR